MKYQANIQPIFAFKELVKSGLVIFCAFGLSLSISWWFYPISLLLLVRSMAVFMFLAHDGVHGVLHPSRVVNDWLSRFICSFPLLMSFSKFKRMHLRHHYALNDQLHDPTYIVAGYFPMPLLRDFKQRVAELLTLKYSRGFMIDNSEVVEIFYRLRGKKVASADHEWIYYICYAGLLLTGLYLIFGFTVLLLLYILPLLFFHLYIVIMTGLQHGPLETPVKSNYLSRNLDPSWIVDLLLPCNVGYHGTHHFAPSVPFYSLPKATLEIEQGSKPDLFWTQSLSSALGELFPKTAWTAAKLRNATIITETKN